ncbi:MAG TPA: ABC transporter ATP-binding protein [Candidatus Limnocylindrales bacterium]|nr:ABC transporter ATP-binding protein [Candidatus Limnocylindrales bacterium]
MVRLEGLSKRFGEEAAVRSVTLEVPAGSFTTLLGPSGCGKTTTLRLIAGFYEPDEGDIFIGARRVNEVAVHRRRTAMVFQDYALFPHMTVADNVGYGLRLSRMPRDRIAERTEETLRFMGLTGLGGRFPNQLSGGQQQRVALARALVMNPEVLLLDEPLSNLDAKLRVSIRAEMIGIQRQLGITTIYVTHDQEEALAMSDWIAVMDRGRIVQWGRPWDLYYHPATPFLADFLGAVNLVRVPVLGAVADGLRIRLAGAEDSGDVEVATAQRPGDGDVLLAIRPEALRLLPDREAPAAGSIVLGGEVVMRSFLGRLMRYTVRIEGQDWLVDQPDPGAAAVAEGRVRVALDPRRIHVLAADDDLPKEAQAAASAGVTGADGPPSADRTGIVEAPGVDDPA